MSAYLTFHRPLGWHFVGLEVAFLVSFALTLTHAVGHFRRGQRNPLFQWLSAFAYGVLMELIAFNFLDNYKHAQFSVQFYHDKLPLYVVCLYPVFLYTGLQLVARWRLPALTEALLVGFAICLIDIPFDIAGVDAGWWTWSTTDKNLAVRWLGVPVTSYYWYLTFGAVYALLGRGLHRFVDRRPMSLWLAPLVGAGVIVGGTLSFLPFHGLKALGVRDDLIVAGHLAGCALLLLSAWTGQRATPKPPSLGPLGAVPILLGVFHLAVLVTVSSPTKMIVGAVAAVAVLTLFWPAMRASSTVADLT